MSFITRLTTTARTAPVARLSVNQSQRFLSSTPAFQKSSGPIDSTKDTLKKADRKVSDAAVKGIETGEAAMNKAKSAVGSGEAQQKAHEMTGEASQKASEMKGEAKEMAGKGKGKAEDLTGEAKGKTQEAAGEAKGKAEEVAGKMKS